MHFGFSMLIPVYQTTILFKSPFLVAVLHLATITKETAHLQISVLPHPQVGAQVGDLHLALSSRLPNWK